MKENTKIVLISVFVLVVLLIFALVILTDKRFSSDLPYYNEMYSDNFVKRVIDGDTFVLGNEEIVRLICVDTPEEGQEGYGQALEFLEDMILLKEVRLVEGIDKKDSYGRLLRYVYVNDSLGEKFVNKEIIDNGFGKVYSFGNNSDCEF